MSDKAFTPAAIGPLPAPAVDVQTPPPNPPDPAKVAGLVLEALTHMAALIESVQNSVPMLHSLGGRVAAMRAAVNAALYHSSPPVL